MAVVPQSLRPFWEAFEAAAGFDASSRFLEAFHFDDNERSANALAQLVLAGSKRATAGLLWAYEAEHKPLPKRGDLSVVTAWEGRPLCVIETTAVAVMPFEDVGESFAATEGEGDGSLRYWKEAHWAFFGRECRRIGKELDPWMPVVCEEFAVIYAQAGR